MADEIPPLSGTDLIKLLKSNGWVSKGNSTHGETLFKNINGKNVYTTVPKKYKKMPNSILGQILGSKQTNLGRDGLLALIEKSGK
jgi:predicted RNA binding protein YcfA (HicA-like mRNA interferase family)